LLKRKLRIKLPDALPRAIEPEDIKQLLAVLKEPRDRALILTLLRTGMRIGELLNTKVQDLNLKEQYIEIFEAQKNRVGRVVYLSKDALAALKKWLQPKDSQSNYLFYGYRGRPLSYEAARVVFKKYLDKAKLSHKPYSLHCLRHTFASEMLNGGMSLQSLQELLGHSDIEMTRRYARLTDNTRREEYYKAMQIIERGDINGHYRFDH
jgi:site-specific recombinase XerD